MADLGSATGPSVSLRDVIVTRELDARPAPDTDHAGVTRAILELAARMVEGPEEVLPRFVSLAMELGEGISSGISVFEPEAEPAGFRWAFLKGTLAAFEGSTTPRNYSPCGVTLDEDRPILTRHTERYYSWIADVDIVLPEVLLVPLHRGREQLGTLWIVSDEAGHFHRGHVAAVSELASFVSIALQMLQTETRLKSALAEQEALTAEMGHRVKNVFSLIDGMIRLGTRSATSKEDLAEALAGRVHALAVAHGLVRRTFSVGQGAPAATELATLIAAVLLPHEAAKGATKGQHPRLSLAGPAVALSERATSQLALVFHELATNAAKYGGLSRETGSVQVSWRIDGGDLAVSWAERGGPAVTGAGRAGFGTRMLRGTVESALGGAFRADWNPEGVEVSLRLPLARLKS